MPAARIASALRTPWRAACPRPAAVPCPRCGREGSSGHSAAADFGEIEPGRREEARVEHAWGVDKGTSPCRRSPRRSPRQPPEGPERRRTTHARVVSASRGPHAPCQSGTSPPLAAMRSGDWTQTVYVRQSSNPTRSPPFRPVSALLGRAWRSRAEFLGCGGFCSPARIGGGELALTDIEGISRPTRTEPPSTRLRWQMASEPAAASTDQR